MARVASQEDGPDLILRLDFLLQLLDLVIHDLEFALHFRNLILRLDQAFGILVTIGANLKLNGKCG